MAIVNFSIPQTLEKRVGGLIRQKGFSSKAEFFRCAAIYFMDTMEKPAVDEEERCCALSAAVEHEVMRQYRGKRLPPLSEQLADI